MQEVFFQRDIGKKVAVIGSGYLNCPLDLRNHADQMGSDVKTLELTSAALDEAAANLPKKPVCRV